MSITEGWEEQALKKTSTAARRTATPNGPGARSKAGNGALNKTRSGTLSTWRSYGGAPTVHGFCLLREGFHVVPTRSQVSCRD
jgi:hypothetical protein